VNHLFWGHYWRGDGGIFFLDGGFFTLGAFFYFWLVFLFAFPILLGLLFGSCSLVSLLFFLFSLFGQLNF